MSKDPMKALAENMSQAELSLRAVSGQLKQMQKMKFLTDEETANALERARAHYSTGSA